MVKRTVIFLYDREAALRYAHRWAYERNPEYYDFDGLGGDCTNFVSQVLAAGGAEQNYSQNGWYFNSINDRSPSWSGVNELYEFLVSEHDVGPRARVVDVSEAMAGDIVQLGSFENGYYHSLIIVDPENMLVAAHTVDSDYRPLSSFNYDYFRVLHVI